MATTRWPWPAEAVLTLELTGIDSNQGFDRLLDIGTRSFAGSLPLDFGTGFFALPGQRLMPLGLGALGLRRRTPPRG